MQSLKTSFLVLAITMSSDAETPVTPADGQDGNVAG
jgi:hypothetical protein